MQPEGRAEITAAAIVDLRVMMLAMLMLLLVEVTAGLLHAAALLPPLLVTGLARLAEIVLLVLVVRQQGAGLPSIGLESGTLARGFGRGLVWSAGFGILAGLGILLLYFTNPAILNMLRMPLPASFSGLILYFIVGGLVAPFTEEIFFRGILFGWLRNWGALPAIAGSTVLFFLAHLVNGQIMATQLVGALVFAIAYEIEKNLLVPVTIHVLGNLAIFTLSLLLGAAG